MVLWSRVGTQICYNRARHPTSWLLVGAIAVSLISIAVLTRTIQLNRIQMQMLRVGRGVTLVCAVLIFFLGFSSLEIILLLLLLTLLVLAPVLAPIWVWLRVIDEQT